MNGHTFVHKYIRRATHASSFYNFSCSVSKNMKVMLVCVGLLVLFNLDLSLSSCDHGQSVKDKMKDYFNDGMCGSKNISTFFARDADASWNGVQFSGLEDVLAHFEAFKNNGYSCEISSLKFNTITIKAQVQLRVTMISKMKGHEFDKNDEVAQKLNELETEVDGKSVKHGVYANLTHDGEEWIIKGLVVDNFEL